MKARIISFLVVVVCFAIVNAVLYGGQELAHLDDSRELDAMSEELDSRAVVIQRLEDQLLGMEHDLRRRLADMDGCKAQLLRIESGAPRAGLPPREFRAYEEKLAVCNAQVDGFNAIQRDHQREFEGYELQLEAYNQLANEFNSLAASSSTRILLVPGRRKGFSGPSRTTR